MQICFLLPLKTMAEQEPTSDSELMSFFDVMAKSEMPNMYLKQAYYWYRFIRKFYCGTELEIDKHCIKACISDGTNRIGINLSVAKDELLHTWLVRNYRMKFTLSGQSTHKFDYEELLPSLLAKERVYMKRVAEERLQFEYTPRLPPIRVSYKPTWCDDDEE